MLDRGEKELPLLIPKRSIDGYREPGTGHKGMWMNNPGTEDEAGLEDSRNCLFRLSEQLRPQFHQLCS
jgi:hypothetical protein